MYYRSKLGSISENSPKSILELKFQFQVTFVSNLIKFINILCNYVKRNVELHEKIENVKYTLISMLWTIKNSKLSPNLYFLLNFI